MTTRAFAALLLSMVFTFSTIVHADRGDSRRQSLDAHDRWLAGGIVGTVVGLGIGHGIEGRYMDKGLIFTISESLSILLIIIGAAVPMPRGASIPLIVVGALGLTGFKIWEIVDIWTGPMPSNATLWPNYTTRLSLLDPHMAAPVYQAGLTIHF